jgi:hypothetical protein
MKYQTNLFVFMFKQYQTKRGNLLWIWFSFGFEIFYNLYVFRLLYTLKHFSWIMQLGECSTPS